MYPASCPALPTPQGCRTCQRWLPMSHSLCSFGHQPHSHDCRAALSGLSEENAYPLSASHKCAGYSLILSGRQR